MLSTINDVVTMAPTPTPTPAVQVLRQQQQQQQQQPPLPQNAAAHYSTLTAVQIPCCLCGTFIWPNAANKCSACLASQLDIAAWMQRGPGGGDIIVHQCRQCRRYQRFQGSKPTSTNNNNSYQAMEPESPELLALCLKHIPAVASNHHHGSAALSSSSTSSSGSSGLGAGGLLPKLHIVDAHWIWTEPHCMRFKVHLTVRYTIENVPVQQRVFVELKNQWKQCPDCNREFTNRTWHAVVQLRQTTPTSSSSSSSSSSTSNSSLGTFGGGRGHKRGLAALEMAIAKQPMIRKHVLKIDATKNGFDFYFLNLAQAQAFGQYLQRIHPMRSIQKSQKLVSTDVKNNTANLRHTLTCELVPLGRYDLVLIQKKQNGKSASGGGGSGGGGSIQKLAGRLVLVEKISSVLTLVDASPTNKKSVADCLLELSGENYYRNEKQIRRLLSSDRLTRFVVLNVELLTSPSSSSFSTQQDTLLLYQGPSSTVSKYALAEVEVARESDLGVHTFTDTVTVITHLGHLLQAGDFVWGYDLERTVGGDWELDSRTLHNHFVIPDVILVKKDSAVAPTVVQPKSSSKSPKTRMLQQPPKKIQNDQSYGPEDGYKQNGNLHHHQANDTSPEEVVQDDEDEESASGTLNTQTKKTKKSAIKPMTKKREKRRRRKEGKRMRELEESAARMGFVEREKDSDDDEKEEMEGTNLEEYGEDHDVDFGEEELWNDPEMMAELKQLETALEEASRNNNSKNDNNNNKDNKNNNNNNSAAEPEDGSTTATWIATGIVMDHTNDNDDVADNVHDNHNNDDAADDVHYNARP